MGKRFLLYQKQMGSGAIAGTRIAGVDGSSIDDYMILHSTLCGRAQVGCL